MLNQYKFRSFLSGFFLPKTNDMKEFSNAKMDKWTLFYTILYIFFSIGMVIYMFKQMQPKFSLITLGSILSGLFFAYFMIPKISLSEKQL